MILIIFESRVLSNGKKSMFHPSKFFELLGEDLSIIDLSSEPRVGGVILDSFSRNHL